MNNWLPKFKTITLYLMPYLMQQQDTAKNPSGTALHTELQNLQQLPS